MVGVGASLPTGHSHRGRILGLLTTHGGATIYSIYTEALGREEIYVGKMVVLEEVLTIWSVVDRARLPAVVVAKAKIIFPWPWWWLVDSLVALKPIESHLLTWQNLFCRFICLIHK